MRKAQVSLVEWDRPAAAEEGRVFDTLSVAMQFDCIDGSMWARVQVGDTWVYVRPAALEELAFNAWRMASTWRDCHWDLDEDACTSLSCRFEPGPKHIARLQGAMP